MAQTTEEHDLMTQAREQILADIRKALGRDTLPEALCGELEERLTNPPRQTRPSFSEALIPRFVNKLSAAAGTVERVNARDAVPAAVTAYLESKGLPKRLAVAPALTSLAWPDGVDVTFGASGGDDLVSVTPCFAAVAETGSLVLLSSPESPTTLNFLPDDHVVVLEARQIVRHVEDVWPLLRGRPEGVPRTVNFITGPSRTADVEQTLQLGAHGPRRLHVMLIET
jgi:L-lactate dehydrogenase complex protein LldG